MEAQDRLSRRADACPILRVYLLGPLRVEFQEQPIEIASRKARALLAFVALRHGANVPRGVLTALLWGDRSEAQARASLRQTLSELRAAFATVPTPPIEANHDTVRWNATGAFVDALHLANLAQTRPEDVLPSPTDVPTGELLEGFSLNEATFEQW